MTLIILWIAVAVLFAVGEYLTISFFMLPFSIGALGALGTYFLGQPLWLQIVVFIVISVILIPLLRPFARKVTRSAPAQQTGINRLLGKEAVVVKDIDPEAGTGACLVEGEQWLATVQDSKTMQLVAGDKATVVAISGTRVVLVP